MNNIQQGMQATAGGRARLAPLGSLQEVSLMSSLSIFCDESGTMAVDDAGGIFCVAVLRTQASSVRLEYLNLVQPAGVESGAFEPLPHQP